MFRATCVLRRSAESVWKTLTSCFVVVSSLLPLPFLFLLGLQIARLPGAVVRVLVVGDENFAPIAKRARGMLLRRWSWFESHGAELFFSAEP